MLLQLGEVRLVAAVGGIVELGSSWRRKAGQSERSNGRTVECERRMQIARRIGPVKAQSV